MGSMPLALSSLENLKRRENGGKQESLDIVVPPLRFVSMPRYVHDSSQDEDGKAALKVYSSRCSRCPSSIEKTIKQIEDAPVHVIPCTAQVVLNGRSRAMETRVSMVHGSLLSTALNGLSAADDLSFSWNKLEVLLHAKGFINISGFLVSRLAKLLVSKKENASAGTVGIRLSAEGIEGFKLESGARDTERVKEGEYFLKKDFSGIQAEGLNVSDLHNGVTDLAIQKAEKPMLWPDPEICMGSRPLSDSFQIQVSQPSGRTIMQWVSPSDLVQELKLNLECRMGIPSSLLRLLFQGKQLEDPLPLSSCSISRNNLVVATLCLRGGATGKSSSTRPFSYKDAVHPENPKPPEALKSKAFLVDKIEEVPSVELIHEDLASHLQDFAERAIICRFNGLWSRSQDLYAWIHANWTHHCKIFFCSKGYFIVLFDNNNHYEKALAEGPWFMGTTGLFLTPWFPDFDPATAVITKTPVWIRIPNLPAELWSTRVFRAIGDTLGSFIRGDLWRESKGLYAYARICVELDLSKGLPEQIDLKINDFVWTQTLDYENTSFRCRHCHQAGHLQNTCPSCPAKKNKANVPKPKSKRWAPCSAPPVADFDSSSSEDEDSDEELNQAPHFVAPSTDGLAPSSDSAIAQKHVHLSSS